MSKIYKSIIQITFKINTDKDILETYFQTHWNLLLDQCEMINTHPHPILLWDHPCPSHFLEISFKHLFTSIPPLPVPPLDKVLEGLDTVYEPF